MNEIYEYVKDNPDYFAWAFGVVNVFWLAFIHFNSKRHENELEGIKQKHDRELESLKHSFNLDLELRKSRYEKKAAQFERYFNLIDSVGRKQNVDLSEKLQPIFHDFMLASLSDDGSDTTVQAKLNAELGAKIWEIQIEANKDYHVFKSETNSLKLIASDTLFDLFEKTQESYERAFNLGGQFINQFVDITMSGNAEKANAFTEAMNAQGKELIDYGKQIMVQMRLELTEI